MDKNKTLVILKGLLLFLVLSLIILTILFIYFNSEYLIQKFTPYIDEPQQCFSVSQDCSEFADNLSSKEIDSLKLEYNQLVTRFNDLINVTNRVYEEKIFWKEQAFKKGDGRMLCWNENTDVPDKILDKKEVCREGCYYKMLCTNSMKPLFDCTDTLTVYTNLEEDEIEMCDVIGFSTLEYPEYDWVVHRVVNITDEGYATKGDANAYPDSYIVKFEDVIFKLIEVKYG